MRAWWAALCASCTSVAVPPAQLGPIAADVAVREPGVVASVHTYPSLASRNLVTMGGQLHGLMPVGEHTVGELGLEVTPYWVSVTPAGWVRLPNRRGPLVGLRLAPTLGQGSLGLPFAPPYIGGSGTVQLATRFDGGPRIAVGLTAGYTAPLEDLPEAQLDTRPLTLVAADVTTEYPLARGLPWRATVAVRGAAWYSGSWLPVPTVSFGLRYRHETTR